MPRGQKGGFDVFWTTYGQGPRQAVLIHCALAQSAVWGGMARHLSGALTMTAFDMPGHGRSGALTATHGEYQALTAGIAADFAQNGPVDAIGHSFGATAALRMAVLWPERVRSLVLIEPVFFAAAYRAYPDVGQAHQALEAEINTALSQGDLRYAAKCFLAIWGNGVSWEDLEEAQRVELSGQMALIEATHPALYEDVGGMLEPGVLEGLNIPVLLIEGSKSPAIIEAINEVLASRLPNAKRSMIVGAGHMAPLSHPSQISTEILRFLRRAET
ncbi:alpha/beta hydrolase [Pseudohalocynthiibacter aestuariivivens]|uniref:Alpha/beta hydrolase n=1 Tax=Roseovarius pelagicus TaxID=2980108 RepID=A0ABY6D904_9RHOB|nr:MULTISPECIES: alpha/beta hydrolase [Rhodobacterales]QIE45469.1 alpha/beta hydrolase [Pseudohalocynthiibacter aestuariivivens]UXX82611.1 alpha/beta hydrolase [Roseovarius pelagicus]